MHCRIDRKKGPPRREVTDMLLFFILLPLHQINSFLSDADFIEITFALQKRRYKKKYEVLLSRNDVDD